MKYSIQFLIQTLCRIGLICGFLATASLMHAQPAGVPPFTPPPSPSAPPPLPPPVQSAQDEEAAPVDLDDAPVTGTEPAPVTAAPADSPAPAALEPVEEDATIDTIIMVDETAPQVLSLLERLTGKPILRTQNLPSVRINFHSQSAMSISDAILALESLLSLNGIAITPMGEHFLKAVPVSGVSTQVPEFLHRPASDLPASEKFYTKLYRLDYLSAAEEVVPLLQNFMSAQGISNITVMPKSNSLLITDSLINLQRVEAILADADTPRTANQEILFFQLKHVRAADVQARLQAMATNAQSKIGRLFQHNTAIEADERTNQIIVLTHPSNVPMITNVIENLDVDIDPRTTTEVFSIKHAEATEIERVLKEVVSGQQQARQDERRTREGSRRAAAAAGEDAPVPEPTVEITGTSVQMENLQFSEYVTIVADERSNAIVAYGTPADVRQIGALIEKIDVLLAQVRIEVVIAEVSLTDDNKTGMDQLRLTWDVSPAQGFPAGGLGFNAQGPSFSAVGSIRDLSLDVLLQKAREWTDFRVLSAPVIVTTHNQEAVVNVSESRPIITGTAVSGVDAATRTSQVQYRDIGIVLTVKPLIGSNGIIQMEIDQKVENVLRETTIDNNQQPVIGKREANSFVSVADGETIVLAGLQSVEDNDRRGSIYILGDLPLFGPLFRSHDKSVERRELMIFIKPHIIDSANAAREVTEASLGTLTSGPQIIEYLETGDIRTVQLVPEPEPEPVNEAPLRRGPRR